MKDEIVLDLQSGTLARLCGVSPDTIRHYERLGLIAAVRGENGYRRFPRETVGRVQLIRRALAIGFSLAELTRILRQRDSGEVPCRGVHAMAQAKLADLDARIAELIEMRAELASIIDEWDERLDATRDSQPALLLEGLLRNPPHPTLSPGGREGKVRGRKEKR